MGRRLNISQPAVIDTQLSPLRDSFWLEANGSIEQWFYDNTGEFAPDRETIPLIITPRISAADTDSGTTYTPSFASGIQWFERKWNGSSWVTTEITNQTEENSNPYVKVNDTLKVRKNVVTQAAYSVVIICKAQYVDPRDVGVSYPVESRLELSINKDATTPYPTLNVLSPASQSYNPLTATTISNGTPNYHSQFTFVATADWTGIDQQRTPYGTTNNCFEWYGISNGAEVKADTLPWYVSGQNTDTLVVDAMYGEKITVILRRKETASGNALMPAKIYRNIDWRIPGIDVIVDSKNGSSVRDGSGDFVFGTIVNMKGQTLSPEIKALHLRFKWKRRNSLQITAQNPEVEIGWGQEKVQQASVLKNQTQSQTRANTLVYNEVYLLGAFEKVVEETAQTGVYDDVTENGELVYDRPV